MEIIGIPQTECPRKIPLDIRPMNSYLTNELINPYGPSCPCRTKTPSSEWIEYKIFCSINCITHYPVTFTCTPISNKSIQRIYNTFEKSPPPPLLSLSLPLPFPLPVLAQLSFLFIRKKKFCLVLSLLAMNWNVIRPLPYSSSLLLLSLPSHYSPLLSFPSILVTLIWGEYVYAIRRTFYVKVATNAMRHHGIKALNQLAIKWDCMK